jgi:hypothetical protein
VGGFRHKPAHVAPLKPDVLGVQEIEPLSLADFPAALRPHYCDRSCAADFPRRGIGMFSYSPRPAFQAVDGNEPFSGFRRYQVSRGGLSFNVAAVWPWATRTAKTSYRQAQDGLVRHRDWIQSRPTVVLGDFNASASFKDRNWQDLLVLLSACGLVSAYHRFKNQSFGGEREATHFHKGKRDALFHLDYCFIPEAWVSQIIRVEVGAYETWHSISDHAPLIVDLSL